MNRVLIIFAAAFLITSCEFKSMYREDNQIEERFEDYIKEHTGIEVDFSPMSIEK